MEREGSQPAAFSVILLGVELVCFGIYRIKFLLAIKIWRDHTYFLQVLFGIKPFWNCNNAAVIDDYNYVFEISGS